MMNGDDVRHLVAGGNAAVVFLLQRALDIAVRIALHSPCDTFALCGLVRAVGDEMADKQVVAAVAHLGVYLVRAVERLIDFHRLSVRTLFIKSVRLSLGREHRHE